ncbi:hypothetical protein QVD99_002332 [Batrachochytrium dendrobatidis]|nr:hypothetical protein O5D80_004958 [Batrachochytrium dendrobatidis]KAK5671310.1 hypothetical protein QVD99_002332 [Batrachochytrium dendrobatidis]
MRSSNLLNTESTTTKSMNGKRQLEATDPTSNKRRLRSANPVPIQNITHYPTFGETSVFHLVSTVTNEQPLPKGRSKFEQVLITLVGPTMLIAWKQWIESTLVPSLHQKATLHRREYNEKYMRGEISYIGLTIPETDKICKSWLHSVNVFIDQSFNSKANNLEPSLSKTTLKQLLTLSLYYSNQFEIKFAATYFWQSHIDEWMLTHPGYDLLALVFDAGLVNEWATCDSICARLTSKAVGHLMKTNPSVFDSIVASILEPWAINPEYNLWKRRAAIVTLIPLAATSSNTLRDTLTRMTTCVVKSPERFLQTAVGWSMRQLSVGHRDHVVEWAHSVGFDFMSMEALRSLCEKLPIHVRKELVMKMRAHRSSAAT